MSILDDDAVRAVLGHEFGHYLAHGPHAEPPVLDPSDVRLHTTHPLRSALQIARELTADRFALLSCRDLAATVRLEVVSATGLPAHSLGLRELDHLADVCQQVERGEVGLRNGSTHPSREFRLFATWLFWRSDLFRTLTGLGPGDVSKTEVDDRLARMLTDGELQLARRNALLLRVVEPAPPAPIRTPPARPKVTRKVSPKVKAPPAPPRHPEPSRAASSLLERIQAFTGDVRQTVDKLRSSRQTRPDDASTFDSALEEQDDIEARFRKLERAHAESPASSVDADLEKRFRELEERARKKP